MTWPTCFPEDPNWESLEVFALVWSILPESNLPTVGCGRWGEVSAWPARTLRSEYRQGLRCVSTFTLVSPALSPAEVTSASRFCSLGFCRAVLFLDFPPSPSPLRPSLVRFLALRSAKLFTTPLSSVHIFILLLSSLFPGSSSLWDYDFPPINFPKYFERERWKVCWKCHV